MPNVPRQTGFTTRSRACARRGGRIWSARDRGLAPRELPDCDVVLLAIPVGAREPYLRDFAARRMAVFCEKPFADLDGASSADPRLFPAHRLGCGYMRRFYRSTRIMHRLLDQQLARPGHEHSVFGGRPCARAAAPGRRTSTVRSSPATAVILMDLGSHGIDLALHLSAAQSFAVRASELTLDGEVDRRVCTQVTLQPAKATPPIPFDCEVSWLDSPANRIELVFRRRIGLGRHRPGCARLHGLPRRAPKTPSN